MRETPVDLFVVVFPVVDPDPEVVAAGLLSSPPVVRFLAFLPFFSISCSTIGSRVEISCKNSLY